jgi:hypothetical protein
MMNDDDLALLGRLGRALAPHDPPPADVLTAARASFAVRDLDGELAALVFDSALELEPSGIRSGGGGGSRVLSFETGTGGVELQVVGDDEGRVLGQVVPAAAAEVEIVAPGGSSTVATDHLGRFALERPAGGPVRLRWRSGDRLTRTDWVVL